MKLNETLKRLRNEDRRNYDRGWDIEPEDDDTKLAHHTVHSIRHTNITMQIAAGVPIVTVADRAGHARTSTTTDIYSHFLKSSDKTAAKKLEDIFND